MRARSRGFSLVEVLVAFVILEIGLLGTVGLMAGASRTLARAVLLEGAAGEAASMADSLSQNGIRGSGELVHGDWRILWETSPEGWIRVSAVPQEGKVDVPAAVLFVP